MFQLLVRLLFSPGWRPLERLKCIALLPAAARVAGELSRVQPDVVHLFWGHYPALVTLLVRPLLPHSRFSLFLGAYDLELRLPVSRWAAELSEVCFTHAHVNIPQMKALVGDRNVHVVHRGIDLSGYPSVDALRFSRRPRRIFTAGRLIPEKGFDKVIHQFADVMNQYPEAELVIAGAGPDLERLGTLVQSLGLSGRVSFPGWLSEAEVREQLLASRVFVLLSSKPGERLPNVVKEAMAAGCVAIASHSPGIDELIQYGVDGFICDVDDGEAIQAAIGYGFANDQAASLSRAAASKIRDAFDVEYAARRYADCWSKLIEHDC
ncbi:glycosyltransferase family 4 protein [Stutzerimonas balearica]|uniref:glycosyltransferase family 4 protein n=1 Tax=Stutzerimonas balearica TaxID=74829 RepID=UPI003F75B1AE